MIYYDSVKYPELLFEKDIKSIETAYSIKCLYGGIIGSVVYGTNNPMSDYDFVFIYQADIDNKYIKTESETGGVHLQGYNIETVRERSTMCLNKLKEFPSFYTRLRCAPNEDIHLDYTIFTSDYIWDSGFLKNSFSEATRHLKPVLILDHYFSRAAGNLEKNLILDCVYTKRIIQTILGINAMFWILENRTMMCSSFSELTKRFHPEPMYSRIMEILSIHQNGGRDGKPVTIPRDDNLNAYIAKCLNYIERCIKTTDWEKFQLSLDQNSFLGKHIGACRFGE